MDDQSNSDLKQIYYSIASMIKASQAGKQLIQSIAEQFGPRPAGSESMSRAVDYLANEWSSLRLHNVHTEALSLPVWDMRDASLEVLSPLLQDIRCVQFINSGSTTINGTLLHLLNQEQIKNTCSDLANKIVLIKGAEITNTIHFPLIKVVCELQENGVSGVIFISQHPELPEIQNLYTNKQVNIPVVGVSAKDGQYLANLVKKETVKIRMTTSGITGQGECQNLIGELGPAYSEEFILFGAHLDSVPNSVGAFDNLSGVATMTEIARALAFYQDIFKRKIRFIAFTAEESGHLGSKAYVQSHASELNQICFYFNMDSIFNSTAKGIAVLFSESMKEYIDDFITKHHPEVAVRNHVAMSSDYLAFYLQGIPAALPIDYHNVFPIWSHTTEDTPDKIKNEWIQENGIVHAQLLMKMLTDPDRLPMKRKSRAEIEKWAKQVGIIKSISWKGYFPADQYLDQ